MGRGGEKVDMFIISPLCLSPCLDAAVFGNDTDPFCVY